MRATRVLVAVGVLLAVGGGVMLWRGAAEGPGGLTVAGILVLLAGLVCLRIAYWRVRVAAMTRAGLALHAPDRRDGKP
jgi:hypothetical protein